MPDLPDRRIAYPPSRDIDDPLEGDVVFGIRHQGEIGEEVFDFHPFVEADAPVKAVGDPGLAEVLFEGEREIGRAVKDGDVGIVGLALHRIFPCDAFDAPGQPFGFLFAGEEFVGLDLFPVVSFGIEVLLDPLPVMGDEGVGGIQDLLGRAVIPIEDHRFDVRETLLEIDD